MPGWGDWKEGGQSTLGGREKWAEGVGRPSGEKATRIRYVMRSCGTRWMGWTWCVGTCSWLFGESPGEGAA